MDFRAKITIEDQQQPTGENRLATLDFTRSKPQLILKFNPKVLSIYLIKLFSLFLNHSLAFKFI